MAASASLMHTSNPTEFIMSREAQTTAHTRCPQHCGLQLVRDSTGCTWGIGHSADKVLGRLLLSVLYWLQARANCTPAPGTETFGEVCLQSHLSCLQVSWSYKIFFQLSLTEQWTSSKRQKEGCRTQGSKTVGTLKMDLLIPHLDEIQRSLCLQELVLCFLITGCCWYT